METTLHKAYKCRIYPNRAERVLIEKHFGSTRFVYNWALNLQNNHYKEHGKSLSRGDIQSKLVAMKKIPEYEWLKEVNSQSLLNALLNVYTAFGNFFKGRTKFPTFKSKKNPRKSYQCPQHCRVDLKQGVINLPKLKGLKAVFSRDIIGKVKTITVSKTATGKYYASVLTETEGILPTPTTVDTEQTIGINLGLSHFATLSDGSKIENPRYLRQSQTKLAAQQKIFARKQKESNNRQRQKLAVARIHEKIRHQRLDLHHKITHQLICDNQANSYAIEDLSVKNMVKNRKLSKAISDAGWGQFITLLTYKAAWYGKNILTVNRFFASSKICSHCQHKVAKLPLNIREWRCENCQTTHDRDINASHNICHQALADALGPSAV